MNNEGVRSAIAPPPQWRIPISCMLALCTHRFPTGIENTCTEQNVAEDLAYLMATPLAPASGGLLFCTVLVAYLQQDDSELEHCVQSLCWLCTHDKPRVNQNRDAAAFPRSHSRDSAPAASNPAVAALATAVSAQSRSQQAAKVQSAVNAHARPKLAFKSEVIPSFPFRIPDPGETG